MSLFSDIFFLLSLGTSVSFSHEKELMIWTDMSETHLLRQIMRQTGKQTDNVSDWIQVYQYPEVGLESLDLTLEFQRLIFLVYANGFNVSEASLLPKTILILNETKIDSRVQNLLTARRLPCLSYDPSQTIPDLKSCDVTDTIDDVTEGIVKQGKWSHVVLIGGGRYSTLATRLKDLKQTKLECQSASAYLVQFISDLRHKEDYINIILDCTDDITIVLIRQMVGHSTSSALERVRYNWLLPRTGPNLYPELTKIVRDGDNIAMFVTDTISYKFDNYFQLWIRGDVIPSAVIQVYRCMSDCHQRETPVYIGAYSSSDDVLMSRDVVLPALFQQFYGRHLKIVCNEYRPLMYQVAFDSNHQNFTGIEKEMIEVLAQELNFSYSLHKSTDGHWGALRNGTWDGMIGMIVRKEADMAAGGITITQSRQSVVDFTTPYYEQSSAVILLLQAKRWAFFYDIFTPAVWLCIACLPFVITAASSLVYVVMCEHSTMSWFKLSASLLYISFGNILAQGNSVSINIGSLRIMRSFYWLAIIILLATYSGNLTARLAVGKIEMPFTSLQGLADDKRYTLVIRKSTTGEIIFKNAKEGIYKKFWDKIQKDPERSIAARPEIAWDRLQSEPYIAYSSDKTELDQYRSDRVCSEGVILPEEFFKSGFGFVLKKGSPYKRQFDIIIMRIIHAGLIDKWYSVHADPRPCGADTGPSTAGRPVSTEDVFFVFVTFAVGLTLGTICLVTEIAFKTMFEKRSISMMFGETGAVR